MILPSCRRAAVLTCQSASRAELRRFSQSSRVLDSVLNQQPAQQARRAAEDATRRKNVGPFPMGQPATDGAPRARWDTLSGGEKLGRSAVNSSNALVVVFGVTLSGLIFYAVSSELFADNSPTRLYEQCTEIIKADPETSKVLQEPLKFHAESSGGRRNRRVRSTMAVDAKTGREKMTIRFMVTGKAPTHPNDEGYVTKIKRWIRPLVVEPSDASALIPIVQQDDKASIEASPQAASSWWGSLFGSLMPTAFATTNTASSQSQTHSTRLRTRPVKGHFDSGEAVATLLMNPKGHFELQSLTVYYPHAQEWQWKTDVQSAQKQLQGSATGGNRYRFWHR